MRLNATVVTNQEFPKWTIRRNYKSWCFTASSVRNR